MNTKEEHEKISVLMNGSVLWLQRCLEDYIPVVEFVAPGHIHKITFTIGQFKKAKLTSKIEN